MKARRFSTGIVGLASVISFAGCPSTDSTGSSGSDKGAREAAAAIAAGDLKLKEYPPLPYPPGHREYVQLLRDRCGVEYELPKLPPGVGKAVFVQEVRAWNDVMKTIEACRDLLLRRVDRVSITIRIDDRKGSNRRMDEKVASAREKMPL